MTIVRHNQRNQILQVKYTQLDTPFQVTGIGGGTEIFVTGKNVLNENYTIVNSVLKGTSDRPEIKIDWRIYTKNADKPLIRDLIIEGLSLARTQKEEFNSVLVSNNNDINELFKTLETFISN